MPTLWWTAPALSRLTVARVWAPTFRELAVAPDWQAPDCSAAFAAMSTRQEMPWVLEQAWPSVLLPVAQRVWPGASRQIAPARWAEPPPWDWWRQEQRKMLVWGACSLPVPASTPEPVLHDVARNPDCGAGSWATCWWGLERHPRAPVRRPPLRARSRVRVLRRVRSLWPLPGSRIPFPCRTHPGRQSADRRLKVRRSVRYLARKPRFAGWPPGKCPE